MPGIDRRAVDRGLAAHRLEPGAVEKGGEQRMEGKRLVQPGDRTGGQGECPGDRRVQCRPSWQEIKHGFHRMVRPARIPRTAATGWWQPG